MFRVIEGHPVRDASSAIMPGNGEALVALRGHERRQRRADGTLAHVGDWIGASGAFRSGTSRQVRNYYREVPRQPWRDEAPGRGVEDGAIRMRENNVGFLPVCDQSKRALGTLTDRDIAIRLVAQKKPGSTFVEDIMTEEVVACSPRDDVRDAARVMAQNQKWGWKVQSTRRTHVSSMCGGGPSPATVCSMSRVRAAGFFLRSLVRVGVAQHRCCGC